MSLNQPILSLSCNSLDPIEQVDTINNLATMWTAFSKCKSFIENGQRLENMSWRLWQFNHSRKPTNKIDNSAIKRFITAVLLSPADTVHDAYSHEVPQQIESVKEEFEQRPTSTEMSRTSSFCMVPTTVSSETIVEKEPIISEQHQKKQFIVITDDDEEEDEDEEEDDYYLSDEDDDYEQDINYHFVNDFKKTQPRPTTPRRSLLSDLFGRVSSPPSLLSNSTSSFTSTTTSIILDNNEHSSHIALTREKPSTSDPSEIRWRESFHGW